MLTDVQLTAFAHWASTYTPSRQPDRHVTPVLLYAQQEGRCTVCHAPAVAAIILEKNGRVLWLCAEHLADNEDIL